MSKELSICTTIPFLTAVSDKRRTDYIFLQKSLRVQLDGRSIQIPCIGLYHKQSGAPVGWPGYERWYIPLNTAGSLSTQTLKGKATAICSFLNYILKNTQRSCLHDVTINDIRDFIAAFRYKSNGKERSQSGWNKGVAAVYDFLASYYNHNVETLKFNYASEDLITKVAVANSGTYSRGKRVINQYNYMGVKGPRAFTTKNRLLLYGYLDLLLLEAEMYDPDIAIGIVMQAYAGLREGEVVNTTMDRIGIRRGGFGTVQDIVIDIRYPAPSNNGRNGNTKVERKQKVYMSFYTDFMRIWNNHRARLESKGYAVDGDAPVLRNKRGKPMSVQTYTGRLRKLFYTHFLPDLKKASMAAGEYADHAPFIEAYENDYPGAHSLRHWFTMYLIERTTLSSDEISKWRGDSSRDAMLDYVHLNADMLGCYRNIANSYQRDWLSTIIG